MSRPVNRRQLLAGVVAAAALGQAQESVSVPGKRPLILHNDRPEDLETPAAYFNTWLTPNDIFFVRQHLPRPLVAEATYRLALNGRVNKPIDLSLGDLRKLRQYTVRLVDSQRLSPGAWQKEVDKMIGWGAAVSDRQALIDYLAQEYGVNKPAPAQQLAANGASGSTAKGH